MEVRMAQLQYICEEGCRKVSDAQQFRLMCARIKELETALDLSLRVMTSSREVLLAHGGGEMPAMNAVIEMAKCALEKVSNG